MKNILVIDDDVDFLNVIKFVLEKRSYKVRIISEPNDVYPAFIEFQPDLVILDVHLKDANGKDMSRELKTLNTENTPVLLCTADQSLKNDYYDSRAEGILLKPFKDEELFRLIKNILKKSYKSVQKKAEPILYLNKVAS